MSSPLPDVGAYWQALSASSPAVQTVEGQGTSPHFDEPEAKGHGIQTRAPRFDNNL